MNEQNGKNRLTHFEFARDVVTTHGKLADDEARRDHFETIATFPTEDIALILLWVGALAGPATVNEFYLGMSPALGVNPEEFGEALTQARAESQIRRSTRESEPPDDAHFTG